MIDTIFESEDKSTRLTMIYHVASQIHEIRVFIDNVPITTLYLSNEDIRNLFDKLRKVVVLDNIHEELWWTES